MTQCSETLFPFEAHFSRRVVAEFSGERLTTEGGSLLLLLSFALPRGESFLRDAQAAQFPVTVGVWAIFVLLFVKLK